MTNTLHPVAEALLLLVLMWLLILVLLDLG